jgi:aromatic ring-cleaving dioxygenase
VTHSPTGPQQPVGHPAISPDQGAKDHVYEVGTRSEEAFRVQVAKGPLLVNEPGRTVHERRRVGRGMRLMVDETRFIDHERLFVALVTWLMGDEDGSIALLHPFIVDEGRLMVDESQSAVDEAWLVADETVRVGDE